jgi:hypothetical protein
MSFGSKSCASKRETSKILGQPIGGHAASHNAKAENRNALHEHAP